MINIDAIRPTQQSREMIMSRKIKEGKFWLEEKEDSDRDDRDRDCDNNPALDFKEGYDREAVIPGKGGNRKLHVICCISNPVRYKSRYKLYKQFAQRIEDSGAILWTIECAFGDRPFQVTSNKNPRHIQVRSKYELWHKENMLNLAVNRLPEDWEYLAWIDADVTFTSYTWVPDTIEQLQHYKFLQLFSHAVDLGPNGEYLMHRPSFMYNYYHNYDLLIPKKKGLKAPYYYGERAAGSSGYAWACTRKAYNQVGGFVDKAILGAADWNMAYALIGKVHLSRSDNLHQNYLNMLDSWQERAEKRIIRNIGYVPGTVAHAYHGPKALRGYNTRERILVDHEFDPLKDLYRDSYGLYQMEDSKPQLRDDIRKYFRARHEDDISEGSDKLLP